MNSDKFVFTIIASITVLILAVIFSTSFFKQIQLVNSELVLGDARHNKGAKSASLTLVEFSDFECPSCKSYAPVLKSLLEKYPDSLAIVYKHFPLPRHTGSVPAARASEAAEIQGKFWEYHDELFLNQPNFSDNDLFVYAQNIGLDVEKFMNDYKSQIVTEMVNSDYKTATGLNLPGTPTFFLINGNSIEQLNLQYQGDLEKKIVDILGPPISVLQETPAESETTAEPIP